MLQIVGMFPTKCSPSNVGSCVLPLQDDNRENDNNSDGQHSSNNSTNNSPHIRFRGARSRRHIIAFHCCGLLRRSKTGSCRCLQVGEWDWCRPRDRGKGVCGCCVVIGDHLCISDDGTTKEVGERDVGWIHTPRRSKIRSESGHERLLVRHCCIKPWPVRAFDVQPRLDDLAHCVGSGACGHRTKTTKVQGRVHITKVQAKGAVVVKQRFCTTNQSIQIMISKCPVLFEFVLFYYDYYYFFFCAIISFCARETTCCSTKTKCQACYPFMASNVVFLTMSTVEWYDEDIRAFYSLTTRNHGDGHHLIIIVSLWFRLDRPIIMWWIITKPTAHQQNERRITH